MTAGLAFEDSVRSISAEAPDRMALWSQLLDRLGAQHVLEIGVFEGRFAEHLLRQCPSIQTYHMVDPWRHLADWNKPANVDDEDFADLLRQVQQRTAFAADRTRYHRGRTIEVIDEIDDASIDVCYIDGDHSLRGITIDLIRAYPKVKPGGIIAGDDCIADSLVQHGPRYEPTLVFPYAAYFAEAHGDEIWFLPHNQFLIRKGSGPFRIVDLVGTYGDVSLRRQLRLGMLVRRHLRPRG